MSRRMTLRDEAVMLVDEADGHTDLMPDSAERAEAYRAVEDLLSEWYGARADEADAASRASAVAEKLRTFGIEIER